MGNSLTTPSLSIAGEELSLFILPRCLLSYTCQLSCYAMYGVEKWGVKPEKIKLFEYNLLSDQSAEFSVKLGEIANTKAYIRGSIADMGSLLADIDNNVPKEEGLFRKVQDERIRNRCNFRKVCD